VSSLGLAGLVVSAPASAQPDSCGAHVVYGKWKRYPTGFQKHRFSDEELNFPPARRYDGTKSC
jgi:hypothetical protein